MRVYEGLRARMCGCMRVYAYLIGCLNQRALLDQRSHRFHVPVLTRENQ